MGLPVRQRRVLQRIEGTLRGSDPRLAALYAIFSRLTRDEEMPRIEQLRYGVRRVLARIGQISAAAVPPRMRTRLVPRQPVLLLFPLALALVAVTIVLAATSGPGCVPARQLAAGQIAARTNVCRPTTTFNTLYGK
jgi:hypothetical protein